MPTCLFRWDNRPKSRSCARTRPGWPTAGQLGSPVTQVSLDSAEGPNLRLALLFEIRTEPARREGLGRNERRGRILDVFDRGVRPRARTAAASATGEIQTVVLGARENFPGRTELEGLAPLGRYPFERVPRTRSDAGMYFQCFLSQRLGPLSLQPKARSLGSQNTRTCMWSSCGCESVGW